MANEPIMGITDTSSAQHPISLPYGVCDTAAATAAKTVSVPGVAALNSGTMICVKFTYANSASSPTLNVNSLGAKNICQYGTTAASTSTTTGWMAGGTAILIYDGTSWLFNKGYNTNTTYSSKDAASNGTAVSLVTTGEKYTWNSKLDGTYDSSTGVLAITG